MDDSDRTRLHVEYWFSESRVVELAERYGVKAHEVPPAARPLVIDGTRCPSCGNPLVWTSRQARKDERRTCGSCEHVDRSRICPCAYCSAQREIEAAARREAMRAEAIREQERWSAQYVDRGYALWAVEKLNRRQRLFYRAVLQRIADGESATWDELCRDAGVVSHVPYVEVLERLKLLYRGVDGYVLNDSIAPDDVDVAVEVRKIRPSTRFEVFQRDEHTCQYCGRGAPEVELVVDHLVPVAEGGDDSITNLVTACHDCNAGKGATLIAAFTGGLSQDEWRSALRERREEELERRRGEIEPVIAHWESCRGRQISEYDRSAVHRFMDRYDPEWIKRAIEIAVARQPSNYVKYVGGILRRWGRTGSPVNERQQAREEVLSEKPATPKQVAYAIGLLKKHGMEIDELIPGAIPEEMSMLEATVIIEELTREA